MSPSFYFSVDSAMDKLYQPLTNYFGTRMTLRGTVPSPRSNHVAALHEDKTLLIFGGATKSRTLNDLYSLDFETVCEIQLLYFLSHMAIIV